MKQDALVIKTNPDGTATVKVLRRSACSACSAKHVCGGSKETETVAVNKIGASEGDTVELEVPSANVLGYSALVFFAPVFLAIVLYLTLSRIGDIFGICGAIAGFALPLTIAFFVSRANAENIRPTIVAVQNISPTETSDGGCCDLRNDQGKQ